MKVIESNIRAKIGIKGKKGNNQHFKWFWFFSERGTETGSSDKKICKGSLERHVNYELKKVKESAKFLRGLGFKVIPPSKV